MATVTVDYFGVSGTGRTVKEAKLDAGRKIESAISKSPKVYSYRGRSVFIYYRPGGAAYVIVHPDSEGESLCSSTCSTDDAERSALHHLLQIARKEGEYECPSWVPREYRKEFVRDWRHNDGFQRAYRKAREMGLADTARHYWACEHTNEFVTPEVKEVA